jgi:ABC-type polar amino acid transport system ATPase subunit
MIQMISVTKKFAAQTILDSVAMSLQAGEVAMVCGPSGSGKSTLLRTLNRMESIEQGDIRIDGRSIYEPGLSLCALRARVGLVFQHCNLFSHLSALDNIVMPLVKVKRLRRDAAVARAEQLLEQFGLAGRRHARPDALSGGERQRVAILRCLAMQPSVMLFDEPTSALDWRLRSEVAANIQALAERGITQLVVTHDLDFACALGDRFFLLDAGRLREVGSDELACCEPSLLPSPRRAPPPRVALAS